MTNPLFDALFAGHLGKKSPFLRLNDATDISHGEFLKIAGRFAYAIQQLGLVPGDRVAVQVDKSPEALALYAACVQTGMVFLPLNTAYTTEEIRYFIEDSTAKLFICRGPTDDSDSVTHGFSDLMCETLNSDGSGSFSDLAKELPHECAVAERCGDDLAALLYTSGTTGRSKGAMLSHDNLLSNARSLADIWRFSASDVLLHALPIFHTHGLFVATNVTLIAGGSMIFMPKFDADLVIGAMPRSTVMMGVPTFYTRLLDDPRLSADLTRHMRLFISGSAPLLSETHARFETRTGQRILERYGMTETNMNASNPYEGERRPGTVGLALPGVEIRISDPDSGKPLPTGKVGEIKLRGPNVFKGYWNMPEKTAEELAADGFFATGDLGLLDGDNYLHIVGRSKDLIISGGYNIYPKEIELLIDEQPGILESAVIGLPHADLGETVVAVVVAENGHSPDLAVIAKAIGASLARFKQPRKLIIIDDLPRNRMGKVQKNILRDRYAEAFS